jgi:hypothetical protein
MSSENHVGHRSSESLPHETTAARFIGPCEDSGFPSGGHPRKGGRVTPLNLIGAFWGHT